VKVVSTPYRTAAPPEPEGPDEADAYEALLRVRASRARRIATTICGTLAALSVIALIESPSPRIRPRAPELVDSRAAAALSNARDTIASARDFAEREQARFAATINAALDASVAPGGRPCAVVLPEVNRLVRGQRAFPLLIVETGDRDLPSPSVANMLADVNRADEHLAAGRTAEAIFYANGLAARMTNPAARLRYDVVLVTTSMKHPERTTPRSFEPGELTGRAYLYDFDERRVTCAGDVHATSSREVAYSYAPTSPHAAMDEGPRLTASLEEDLERQIQRAISHGALLDVAPR